MAGIIDSLLPAVDSILGVRDKVGAVIKPVSLVTRTWYDDASYTTLATTVGGYARDEVVRMIPSPGLKDFAQDIRLREGGAIQQGDIVLSNVSKHSYAKADLDGSSPSQNVEKLFKVGDDFYQSINVREKYLTWDVQIRKLTNQTAGA